MARNPIYSGDGLSLYNAVLARNYTVEDAMKALGVSKGTLYNYYAAKNLSDKIKTAMSTALDIPENELFPKSPKSAGASIRAKKAFEPTEDHGLIYVPIAAQAGYSRNFTDPVFINQLDRLYIPGLPYKGDNYRYFDVEGDSMEPGLQEGMQVIGELVPQEFWKDASDYYIHVIVLENRICIKRIFKKNSTHWVLISDNEDLYPQELLPLESVKEVWHVKRKLDWRMTPPKQFEIKV